MLLSAAAGRGKVGPLEDILFLLKDVNMEVNV